LPPFAAAATFAAPIKSNGLWLALIWGSMFTQTLRDEHGSLNLITLVSHTLAS
jgi:hypothetical protein